jgi:hypothetical protein
MIYLFLTDSVTTLFSGTKSKAQNDSSKKKAILTLFKSPVNVENALLLPTSTEQSQKLHTYISNENPIIGKIFVQELPALSTEQSQVTSTNVQLTNSYGPPSDSYGPAVITA